MWPWLLILGSYLFGSVPFGLLAGFVRGVDLREVGSGNIGATNAGRALGRKVALFVFVLDFAKGFLPVFAAGYLLESAGTWPLWCGVAAVLGHVFPLYLKFRGGKGVATAAGAFFAMAPQAALVALVVWVLTLAISRYVALASVLAAWSLPIGLVVMNSRLLREPSPVLLLSLLVAVLITFRHRTNVQRMFRGEEPRVGVSR